MHAKTDSEGTSLATSSPEHNRRPVYFVQSPDAEKFTASFESTPGVNSPSLGSPRHCHSRESSTSRFSGSLKSGFKRMPPNGVGLGGTGYRTGGEAIWKEYDDAIEEEGLLEDEEPRRGSSPRCYLIGFVVVFIVLFSLFSLILLGVSKHYRPRIGMTRIKFDRLLVHAGSDDSGVSTDMISTKATVTFTFRNVATFFGVHVSATPLTLSYLHIKIGSGQMEGFYQPRNGAKQVVVTVVGDEVPLYGNGADLSTPNRTTAQPVPLNLDLMVRSRARVLGDLVKPVFIKKIGCRIWYDAKKLNVSISLQSFCSYG